VHTGAANAAATADGNAASAAAASLTCRLLLLLLLLGVCAPVQCCLINASHLVVHKQAGQQHRQAEDLRAVLGRLQDTQAVCYQSLSVPTNGASARVTSYAQLAERNVTALPLHGSRQTHSTVDTLCKHP
jgi:hypothetical protein